MKFVLWGEIIGCALNTGNIPKIALGPHRNVSMFTRLPTSGQFVMENSSLRFRTEVKSRIGKIQNSVIEEEEEDEETEENTSLTNFVPKENETRQGEHVECEHSNQRVMHHIEVTASSQSSNTRRILGILQWDVSYANLLKVIPLFIFALFFWGGRSFICSVFALYSPRYSITDALNTISLLLI